MNQMNNDKPNNPDGGELEAGIILWAYIIVMAAAAFIGGATGALIWIFATLLLAIICIADYKIGKEHESKMRYREMYHEQIEKRK